MTIRPMQGEDIPHVMEIAERLPEAPHWAEAAYAAALDPDTTPRRIAMVAEDSEGRVSGFVMALVIPPQAELETIAVSRDAQRKGIAGRLLAELFTKLKSREITEVLLEVRQSNHSARAFYASAGFEESGRRSGYYSDPKEDAILLARRLP